MTISTREICLDSTSKTDLIDITDYVKDAVSVSKVRDGLVNIFTRHTTTAIRINENETGLLRDIRIFLEKKAPQNKKYTHDDIEKRKQVPVDEPANAHSHLKSLILGSSETIPLISGSIALGKWQRVFFVDLDGPRKRSMIVHVVGE